MCYNKGDDWRFVNLSLRCVDVLRLSWASIVGHKNRSCLVVLMIVAFFGVILAISMMYQGLENSVLSASVDNTGGAAYITTGIVQDYYYNEDYGKIVMGGLPENADAIVSERVRQYRGEIIGKVSDVSSQREWRYDSISQSAVEDFISERNDNLAKVAVVDAQDESGELDVSFQIVGTYPSTALGRLNVENALFALVLDQISPSPREVFVVDNGSNEFLEYRARENEVWREKQNLDFDPEPPMLMVVKFDNVMDAARYYANLPVDGVKYGYSLSANYKYIVKDLFNNTISVTAAFTFYQMILLVLGVIFVVFAVWIMTLTFTHIADEDVATIALYRSMGARTTDIYLIYGVYLLSLSVMALAICLILAFLFVGVMIIFNVQALTVTLREFYKLKYTPSVSLVGFNIVVILVVVAVIVIAPVTLLFVGRKFSVKQIARKLKEG